MGAKPKNKKFGAKVLLVGTKSEDKFSSGSCQFCQQKGHRLHECQTFFGKNMIEKKRFNQDRKLPLLVESFLSHHSSSYAWVKKIYWSSVWKEACADAVNIIPLTFIILNEIAKRLSNHIQTSALEGSQKMNKNSGEILCRGVLSTETNTQFISSMCITIHKDWTSEGTLDIYSVRHHIKCYFCFVGHIWDVLWFQKWTESYFDNTPTQISLHSEKLIVLSGDTSSYG